MFFCVILHYHIHQIPIKYIKKNKKQNIYKLNQISDIISIYLL